MKAALSLTLIALLATGCVVKKSKSSEVMDLNDTPPMDTTSVEPLTTTTPPSVPVAPLEAEPSAGGARSHKIGAGDTPWNLAVKYYGDGKQWQKIINANPGLTPSRLPIGKTIVIP